MGLFASIVKLGLDVATTPIAVVKDVVTLGGITTETESAIKQKIEQIDEDLEDVKDEVTK